MSDSNQDKNQNNLENPAFPVNPKKVASPVVTAHQPVQKFAKNPTPLATELKSQQTVNSKMAQKPTDSKTKVAADGKQDIKKTSAGMAESVDKIVSENKAKNLKTTKDLNQGVPEKSSGGAVKLLWGMFVVGVLLFIAFYAVLLWGLLSGDVSNPMFTQLGIESSGLQSLLLNLTNFVFGSFALAFLVGFLVSIFKWFLAGKHAYNRKSYLRKFGIFFVSFFVIVGIWIFFYMLITNLNVKKAVKVTESLIETVPRNVIGLTSPIQIEFDVSDKLFAKISRESIRKIDWDFQNDGIVDSSGPKVIHRFLDKGLNGGRFPVTATIYYFSEAEQKEKSFSTVREVIISNEKILGVFTASAESGSAPLETELSVAESSDPDGEIVSYEWDLDDDGEFEIRGTDKTTIKKVFEQSGDYKVKVRLMGSNQDFIVLEKTIKVLTPEGSLRAEITSDKVLEGYPPFKVSLDGSNSFVREGKITRYEWLLTGDKEPFLGRKRQVVLRNPGEYKISLIVQNDIGERHKITKTISVLKENDGEGLKVKTTPRVVADDGILRGKVPFNVVFDSSQSDIRNALEWQWDFENDGISDAFTSAVEKVFRTPGMYDVKLTIIDADEKRHELIQTVEVERAGIQAKIAASPISGAIPLRVDFDGSGSSSDDGEIVDYIWEFPNTKPIHYGAQISRIFKELGNHEIKLTILTSTGKRATTTTIISARTPVIKADFSFSPNKGTAPLKVLFDPASSTGIIEEYLWDFGDGHLSRDFTPTHVYNFPGVYTATLQVTDPNGLVDEISKTVTIKKPRQTQSY